MKKIKKYKAKSSNKGIISKIYEDFKNNKKNKEKKRIKIS